MSSEPVPQDQADLQEATLAFPAPGSDPPRDLTGTILEGFAIQRMLGRGGMGEVYLARQLSLDRPVALKVIRGDIVISPTTLARFRQESMLAAKIRNEPNIVVIFDIQDKVKPYFIWMEYVEGFSLRQLVEKKGPPKLDLALSIMKQAASAVRAAGEVGLIHRDIKPENILITKKGLVKVADFGLCRLQDDAVALTQHGVTMGTPTYMSPEQAQGHKLDHRSDLYSLGITFYHMLAGEPPFRAESPIALAVKHVRETPVDLATRRPDLPQELCRLVMKLMEKVPEDRYQSAAELLRDLAKIRGGLLGGTLPSGQSIPTVSGPIEISRPNSQPSIPTMPDPVPAVLGPVPNSSRFAWLLPTAAVLCLALGAVIGWRGRAEDLLSADRPEGSRIPALWMGRDWETIPKQVTAREQYRYAQYVAPDHRREAAWAAVFGNFPRSLEWSSRAYTQLGRELFRRGDSNRLATLADELRRTERSHNEKLASILEVGAHVLDGDTGAVVNGFGSGFVRELADASLTELALEITAESMNDTGRRQMSRSMQQSLIDIQRGLAHKLIDITARDTWGRPLPL